MPWSAKGTACVLAVIAAITLACRPLIEYGPHTGDSPSKGRDKPLVVSLLLIFAGAWFLKTPLSTPVWHYVPALQKVQFPWRVMVIQEFAVVSTLILALGCCLENRAGHSCYSGRP